jgi:hypothetical protein
MDRVDEKVNEKVDEELYLTNYDDDELDEEENTQ